jgi:hypothetical protein
MKAFNRYGNESSNEILISVRSIPQDFVLTSTADNPDLDKSFWINWTRSQYAQNYSIYLNDSLYRGGLTNNSYLIENLSVGDYEIHMKAFNRYGNESSNEILISVRSIPQDFVLISTADNPDLDKSFWINWTDSQYAQNYSIYLNDSLYREGLTNNSYWFSNLSFGEYRFKLTAFNRYGNESSNSVLIIIPPLPQPFTLTSTADNPDLDKSFWINWTDSQYAQNYSIYLNDSLYREGLTNNSYLIENLSVGDYEIHMKAFNRYGNESSNEILISIRSIPLEFNLTYESSLDWVILNWSKSSFAKNYSIYQNNTLIVSGISDSYTYLFSNLSEGIFVFSIFSFNDFGNMSSNIVNISIEYIPDPFSLTSSSDLDKSFWINWTSSQYAQNYSIYLNDSLYLEGLTNNSYRFKNLTKGDYNIYIKAIGYKQFSIKSNSIHISIEAKQTEGKKDDDFKKKPESNDFWIFFVLGLSILAICVIFLSLVNNLLKQRKRKNTFFQS